MPKLFVGAWLPPKVQRVLADYPRPSQGDLRWSTPSQWLVNIRPLGDVAAALIPGLVDALERDLDGAPKVKASFGPVYREGWLMAPVLGLDDLRDVVFEATEELVPLVIRRPWNVGLVLARGKATKELVQPLPAAWTVDRVCLAKATRTKDGPGYDDIETFALGA